MIHAHNFQNNISLIFRSCEHRIYYILYIDPEQKSPQNSRCPKSLVCFCLNFSSILSNRCFVLEVETSFCKKKSGNSFVLRGPDPACDSHDLFNLGQSVAPFALVVACFRDLDADVKPVAYHRFGRFLLFRAVFM